VGMSKLVIVETPGTRSLAELNGIRQDLATVRDLCDRLLAYPGSGAAFDDVLYEALATSAAIRYGRCFLSGVTERRDLYERIVPQFAPEQAELHRFVIDFRSKFIAHSVNTYEQNDVIVGVPDPLPQSWVIADLSFHHTRPLGFGGATIRGLRELAVWVDARVLALIEARKPAVLQEIRAIPLPELAAKPTLGPRPTSRAEVRKPR